MYIKGIAWAGTRTENFQETVDFFHDILNFKIIESKKDLAVFQLPNGDIFEVVGPSLSPELEDLEGPKVDFLVSDVDDVVKTLEDQGETFDGEIFREESQNWVNFYAPDGYMYGFTDLNTHPLHEKLPEQILFYDPHDECGFLSNWYPAPVYLKEKIWPTPEHYYHAQKMAGTEYEEICRLQNSPREAFEMSRRPDVPIREDWEDIRVKVMRKALFAKFQQHPELAERLLETGGAKLIEDSPVDDFWGIGEDGTGDNVSGKILMEIRERFKEELD